MDKKTFEMVFQLKMATKGLERQARKAEKEAEKARQAAAKALAKGNREAAEIYAGTVLRKRAEGNQSLRLAAGVDALKGRVEAASLQGATLKAIGSLTKSLEKTAVSGEALVQSLAKFEAAVEDAQVREAFVADTLAGQSQGLGESENVAALIAEMEAEAGSSSAAGPRKAAVSLDLPDVPDASPTAAGTEASSSAL